MQKFISFDLEIAAQIPEGQTDWWELAPFGITCAATLATNEDTPMVWCGRGKYGEISPKMQVDEITRMIEYLQNVVKDGYQLLAFNGAGLTCVFWLSKQACTDHVLTWPCIALIHISIFFVC